MLASWRRTERWSGRPYVCICALAGSRETGGAEVDARAEADFPTANRRLNFATNDLWEFGFLLYGRCGDCVPGHGHTLERNMCTSNWYNVPARRNNTGRCVSGCHKAVAPRNTAPTIKATPKTNCPYRVIVILLSIQTVPTGCRRSGAVECSNQGFRHTARR